MVDVATCPSGSLALRSSCGHLPSCTIEIPQGGELTKQRGSDRPGPKAVKLEVGIERWRAMRERWSPTAESLWERAAALARRHAVDRMGAGWAGCLLPEVRSGDMGRSSC